jgi:polysaccharide export outer membrane protein
MKTFTGTKTMVVLAMIFGPILVAGQAYSQTTAAGTGMGMTGAALNYKIGPGDVIDILVTKNETLSRTGVRVSSQGTIQLPMLDNGVQAACQTESQLADRVKEEYKKYLVSPSVNVSVREFNSNPVAVIGAVNSPGRFQMQRPMRVAELLTFVNGPSANAGKTIDIIRDPSRPTCEGSNLVVPSPASEELLSLNLDDVFKGGDQTNPPVMAGDIVRVAEADKVNAYIQGNIRSSLAISLAEPVTLTQAIAMAGGTTSGAQLDKIKIRRQIVGSINRDELLVNLKDINQGKRDDVLLQPNDIIDVPGPSGSKKFLTDIFRSVIPAFTRVPLLIP